jgi:hypothetical protein
MRVDWIEGTLLALAQYGPHLLCGPFLVLSDAGFVRDRPDAPHAMMRGTI